MHSSAATEDALSIHNATLMTLMNSNSIHCLGYLFQMPEEMQSAQSLWIKWNQTARQCSCSGNLLESHIKQNITQFLFPRCSLHSKGQCHSQKQPGVVVLPRSSTSLDVWAWGCQWAAIIAFVWPCKLDVTGLFWLGHVFTWIIENIGKTWTLQRVARLGHFKCSCL